MKKNVALFLAVLLLITVLPAFSAQASESYYRYVIADGEVTITGYRAQFDEMSIPAVIEDLPVTGIADYAFSEAANVKKFILPEGIKRIGEYAFSECSRLTEVQMGAAVELIGENAFYECSLLERIVIDDENAFYADDDGVLYDKEGKTLILYPKGNSRTSYKLLDSTETIPAEAFYEAYALVSVEIGAKVSKIGELAFNSCPMLEQISVSEENTSYKSVGGCLLSKDGKVFYQYPIGNTRTGFTIPDGVETIMDEAFCSAWALEDIVIPNSVVDIRGGAFSATSWLDNQPEGTVYAGLVAYGKKESYASIDVDENGALLLREGTRGIAENAFSECDSIKIVEIPDSVEVIGANAFSRCQTETASIGSGVRQIGAAIFRGNQNLKAITVSEDNEYYKSVNGNIYTKDGKVLVQYAYNDFSGYTVPDGVETIAEGAFASLLLVSVSLPDSVTLIEHGAFNDNEYLSSVDLGNGVKTIEDSAFSVCPRLSKISIPDSVEHIGESAFSSCNLTYIKIGSGVKTIEDWAFSDSNTIAVFMGEPPTDFGRNVFGSNSLVCYQAEHKALWAPNNETEWNGFDLVSYVAEIDFTYELNTDGAVVTGYRGIDRDIKVPSTIYGSPVISIGEQAFAYNFEIDSVELPSGLKRIGMAAFMNSSLQSINLPDTVIEIGAEAFANTKLKTVTIPKSVQTIGGMPFGLCLELTEIEVDPENTAYKDDEGVLYTADEALLMQYPPAKASTEYRVLDGTKTIGDDAFADSSRLENITLPDGLTAIKSRAFRGCTRLTEITIPEGVDEMGMMAFYNCYELKSVTFEGAPPTETEGWGLFDMMIDAEGGERPLDVTLYYYPEYASAWAPNGETEWFGYPIAEIALPCFTFTDADGSAEVQYIEVDEENLCIVNLPPRTTAEELEAKLGAEAGELTGTLKTGDKVTMDGKEYVVVIMGDLNSDGDADSSDASQLLRAVVQLETLTSLQALAANTGNNESYSASDAAAILRFVVRLEATVGRTN
ncbi:MAG: leucine-rich repeat protein [Clostridia bacterium]|nr:leucine-rich repeat protein [Clostridia bacterium]